jgi:hypothetical protein
MKEQDHLQKVLIRIVLCSFIIIETFVVSIAQNSPASQSDTLLPYSKQAQTSPISSTRITLRLTEDDGEVAEVTQLEGGTIRVERLSDGVVTGLVPVITPDGEVQVRVFNIETIRHGNKPIGESMVELMSPVIGAPGERVKNMDYGFLVEVVNVGSKKNEADLKKKERE